MNADTGPSPDAVPLPTVTAGTLLRAAREKQGLHIAALAASIKVSPRKLEALEADRLGELPDATFARALAQTVCRTLKIDPRPVLERLPSAGPQVLVPTDTGLNEPYRESVVRMARPRNESALSKFAMRPMFWAAALLLVASVGLYFAPLDSWRMSGPMLPPVPPSAAPTVAPAADAASAALGAVLPAASAASAASAPSAAGPAVASSAPSTAPSSAASSAVLAAVSAAQAPAVVVAMAAVPPAAAEPAAPLAPGSLQLRVREASWIDVRDSRGSALLSRTVLPGEQVGLDGRAPLALVIGNAAATDLVFRGQPVDLAARSRDNVARLQLP